MWPNNTVRRKNEELIRYHGGGPCPNRDRVGCRSPAGATSQPISRSGSKTEGVSLRCLSGFLDFGGTWFSDVWHRRVFPRSASFVFKPGSYSSSRVLWAFGPLRSARRALDHERLPRIGAL